MNDEIALAISKSLEKIAQEFEELNRKLDAVIGYNDDKGQVGYITTFDQSR